MRIVDAAEIDRTLAFPELIAAIEAAFRADIAVPVRHHHEIARPGRAAATHLLMPAWTTGAAENFLGAKVVNVFPDNAAAGLPSVMGTYLLMSGDTGAPLAVMDGARLTLWRTAAASALAARFLARAEARTMLMVGAGALAPFLVRAHAAVRPIRRVALWNRDPARCAPLAEALSADGLEVEVAADLEAAARKADVISCATLSREPLIRGAWLKAGAHLDLVGAYAPQMRESDDEAVRRARLFVDTRGGALKEGGDLVQPIAAGVVSADKVEADLFDLCRGRMAVERGPEDVTLFKSVGTAIEDLAAAMLVWRKLSQAA